jgi:hypothetical protein
VILAALGEAGELNERIRRRSFHTTRAERNRMVASVSAAVRGRHGAALGSVSPTGPADCLTASVLAPRTRHRAGGEAAGRGPWGPAGDGLTGDAESVSRSPGTGFPLASWLWHQRRPARPPASDPEADNGRSIACGGIEWSARHRTNG